MMSNDAASKRAHLPRALLAPSNAPTPSHSLAVITVGDGDLSYSLALQRCFGAALRLTATTLLSSEELRSTYSSAAATLEELRSLGAVVLFGVDATALHAVSPRLGPQDVVVFNFPHLGDGGLADEAAHARRHAILVAHLLSEAS